MTPPPNTPKQLLALVLDPVDRDDVIGDLDEQYQEQIRAHGHRRATLWYWRQAAQLAWGLRRGRSAELAATPARGPMMSALSATARDAARMFRRDRAATVAIVLSLALGIGANIAIFSILNSLVFRSLPVPEADRLVQLLALPTRSAWSYPQWEQIRARPGLYESATAWTGTQFNLAQRGESNFAAGLWVSGDFFKVFQVRPSLGRLLGAADDVRGSPEAQVAVVSHGFWQRHFGGSDDAIGARLSLGRLAVTVVGVTPPGFFGPEVGRSFDLILPLSLEAQFRGRGSMLDQRSSWWLSIVARLPAGGTRGSLEAALRSLQPRIREATLPPGLRPEALAAYLVPPITVVPAATGSSYARTRYREPLAIVMAIVALVLFIACANIANLLLARTEMRRHEFAVRLALGASRARLLRQLLFESLILSGMGAIAGIAVAQWGGQFLLQQLAVPGDTMFLPLPIDWRVMAFMVATALATALLFGLAPALRGALVSPSQTLQLRSRTPSSGGRRLAGMLVVAQLAVSLILVVAAGLLVRSFASLSSERLGFDPDAVLTVMLSARPSEVTKDPAPVRIRRVLEEVRAAPGVEAAALSQFIPTGGNQWDNIFENPPGLSLPESARDVFMNSVSPGWFRTLGTRLLAGRDFDWADAAHSDTLAVVNQTLARTFFPGQDPIGQTLREIGAPGQDMPAIAVIGVVEDAVYLSAREGTPPTLYRFSGSPNTLMVRGADGSSAAFKATVAQAIDRADRDFLVTFNPLAAQVRVTLARERILAMLSGFFGVLAMIVAGLGVYGVMATSVNRRRSEIGVRRALGATEHNIVRLIVGRGAGLVGIGLAVGAAISLWSTTFLESLLYGMSPRDPATIAAAAALLLSVALVAIWLPSRRAARVDPARVLREG
jgi:putative ABC transport system permease protein